MLLDSDFLQKLERISLVSRRIFLGQLLANRSTGQSGSGMVFTDYRNYYSGDDLRYLDWNVYARFGNTLIRRFEEDKELNVYLFLDCSRSMEGQKEDYAKKIAAALAYIALSNLDRVSIIPFADKLYPGFPAIRGKQYSENLFRFLETQQSVGRTTDIAASMNEFIRQKLMHGLAVIISDFFDPKGFSSGLDILYHHNFEPVVIQIYDANEADPNFSGDIYISDVETGRNLRLTANKTMIRRYKKKFADFLTGTQRYCTDNGFDYSLVSTSKSFDDVIMKILKKGVIRR